MNLDEYRALKEAESTPPAPEPEVVVEPEVIEPEIVESTPKPDVTPEPVVETPQVFNVNGQEVTLDELQKGYLRQSDYTKKTQEIARKEREFAQAQQIMEQMQANPELAQQVGYDPVLARYQQVEQELADLRLQQEITTLSTKYADFDINEVIPFALERKLDNLEDAYLLNKQYQTPLTQAQTQTVANTPPIDVETLKAQIRAELQAEMNTSTIISGSGGAPKSEPDVELSEEERKVARMMRMSEADYMKWR